MKTVCFRDAVFPVTPEVWETVEENPIANFPWDKTGYKPKVTFKLFHSREGFHVRFEAEDEHILAVNTEPNSSVCQDSCVEWFVNPSPQASKNYVNFEINPLGTLHAGFGENIFKRELLSGETYAMIKIKPYISSPAWRMEYFAPFKFFEKLYGPIGFTAGHEIAANFYKC
ncbi:MAG: carbohydrate-binding family 9-like protein, partial [Defluviitaleaceae bacterium]|nr:carbohydrate-binding family 9-like protein [Defluviitaleaceae bacterium]